MIKAEKIFGIKKAHFNVLHKKIGFNIRFKNFLLNDQKFGKLNDNLANKKQARVLKEYNTNCITFLKNNKLYRGNRHRFGLPVRGQRTHTNAKTVKKICK